MPFPTYIRGGNEAPWIVVVGAKWKVNRNLQRKDGTSQRKCNIPPKLTSPKSVGFA